MSQIWQASQEHFSQTAKHHHNHAADNRTPRAVGRMHRRGILGIQTHPLSRLKRILIDPADLRELWHHHADRLLLIARSMGDGAEDAVQEAFVALARQPAPPQDPLAWLVRVARNAILQYRRAGGRRRQRESVASQRWFAATDRCQQFPVSASFGGL